MYNENVAAKNAAGFVAGGVVLALLAASSFGACACAAANKYNKLVNQHKQQKLSA